MQKAIIEDSWLRGAKRTGFSVAAAAVAFVAGFLSFIPPLLFLTAPLLVLLLAGAVVASFRPTARSRNSRFWLVWLLMAPAAAWVAGLFLCALIFGALVLLSSDPPRLLLWIPGLFLLLAASAAASAAASVWLARRSGVAEPWLWSLLIGAGANPLVWLVLFLGAWFGGD